MLLSVRALRAGRSGTPAPVAPTERLVVGGLYRHVRNPMYLAVLAMIVGQALVLWRPILFAYAARSACRVAVRPRYEEPTLTPATARSTGLPPGGAGLATDETRGHPGSRGLRDWPIDLTRGVVEAFSSYQNEIYLAGLGDVTPDLPTDLTRLEALAEERMPAPAFGYVAGSAGSESTARANRAAFEAWRIVPRMLRDVSVTDLSVTVLGTAMPAPVLLAPIGVLSIVHPDGESAVARAAAGLGLPIVVSTAGSTTLEEVAEAGGDGPRWYQLYWSKDRELAASFLERAAASGFRALVVTLDTFSMGWRPRDLDRAFLPFLRAVGNQNYLADPVFQRTLGGPPDDRNLAAPSSSGRPRSATPRSPGTT